MKINSKGLELIKRWEGLELKAYRCPANVLTIGYGSTGDHVKENMVITEKEAEALLLKDLERFEEGVQKLVPDTINENQFSALVSLAYNIGLTNLKNSTLLKKLVKGDMKGAADQFLVWRKAAGKVLKGLVKRREAERSLFLEPV